MTKTKINGKIRINNEILVLMERRDDAKMAVQREYSEGEKLFFEYAAILGIRLDKGIISSEKYEKLYRKLVSWNLHK